MFFAAQNLPNQEIHYSFSHDLQEDVYEEGDLQEILLQTHFTNVVIDFEGHLIRVIVNPENQVIKAGFMTINFPVIIAPQEPLPEDVQERLIDLLPERHFFAGGSFNGKRMYELLKGLEL